jgi:integrase
MQAEATTADSRRLTPVKGHPGIFKRGHRYVVRFRGPDGRSRKRFARTLAEARDLKASLVTDIRRGDYRDRSKSPSFEQYAADWIRSYPGRTSHGLRDGTRRSYGWELGLELGPDGETWQPITPNVRAVAAFGRMPVSMIRPSDVRSYIGECAKGGKSRDTVRLRLVPLRALLATATEDDLLDSNPAAGVRIATEVKADEEPEEKVKALTEDELSLLLGEVPVEYLLLVQVLAGCGLRISEALPLRWEDIDLGRRRLLVRRSLSRGQIGPPKTHHGRRDVPLSEGLARSLWNERKRRESVNDDDLVFPGADGFLDRGTVYRVVRAAAKRAGVPSCGLHMLRHSCASILFRQGWNPAQVCKFLGHHSPSFTLATYIHLLPEDLPEPTFLDDLVAEGGEPEEVSPPVVSAAG